MSAEHLVKRNEVEEAIPLSIDLGVFQVDCTEVRDMLMEKHNHISQLLLALMASKTNAVAEQVCQYFEEIENRLSHTPSDIEDLVEMREYMETVPLKVKEQEAKIAKCLENFDVLDDVKFRLEDGDFDRRWAVFGWPKTVDDKMIETDAVLEDFQQSYNNAQQEEQAAFVERLKGLESEVDNLHSYNDISKVAQVAPHVAKLKADLEECTRLSNIFNSREVCTSTTP